MNANDLKALLEQVRIGDVTPDAALDQIKSLPFEDLGFAKVDHHRALRVGVPEVIFGPGKSPEHFVEIYDRLAKTRKHCSCHTGQPGAGSRDTRALPGCGA